MPLDYVLLGGLVCIFNRNNGQNPGDDDSKSAIKPHRCIELYTVEKCYRYWFSLKNCQVEHLERLSIFADLFCLFKKCSVISSNIFLAHLQINWWLPKNANFRETLDLWFRSESKVSTSCACMVLSPMTSVEGA